MSASVITVAIVIFIIFGGLGVRLLIERAGTRSDAHRAYKWHAHEFPKQKEIGKLAQHLKAEREYNSIRTVWEPRITEAHKDAERAQRKTDKALRRGKDPTRHAQNHLHHTEKKRTLMRAFLDELGITDSNDSARVNKATGQTQHGFRRPGQGAEVAKPKDTRKWGGSRSWRH